MLASIRNLENINMENILFKNFAKVPSVIDSPIKGTTTSTESPAPNNNTKRLSNFEIK